MISKNCKRVLSLLLVLILAFSVSAFAYADDETADNVIYETEEEVPFSLNDPDDFVLDDNWKPYDPDLFENDMPTRDETWVKKGSLKTVTNGGTNWHAQGFAVGTGYCYSIDQYNETSHKLYRKNMNNNSDAELMTQVGTVDSLRHANDMTLATYTDSDSVVHRYLFVLANSSDHSNSYIIKLEYDGLNYWQVARYNLLMHFSSLAKVRYYSNTFNTQMIQFVLGINQSFYTIAIQRAQTGTHYLIATHRFDVTIPVTYTNYARQCIHYDSGKLYYVLYGYNTSKDENGNTIIISNYPKNNVILVYSGVDSAISSLLVNSLSPEKTVLITANTSDKSLFEIEGIGFPVNNPNLDCDRLWFTTNERSGPYPVVPRIDGGIYADTQDIR